MTFTHTDVLRAALTAVRIMGREYVYTLGGVPVTKGSGCYYSTAQENWHGSEDQSGLYSDTPNRGSASCIVGWISRILNFPLADCGPAYDATENVPLTTKARAFLTAVQLQQDTGVAWGAAVDSAEAFVSHYNEDGELYEPTSLEPRNIRFDEDGGLSIYPR